MSQVQKNANGGKAGETETELKLTPLFTDDNYCLVIDPYVLQNAMKGTGQFRQIPTMSQQGNQARAMTVYDIKSFIGAFFASIGKKINEDPDAIKFINTLFETAMVGSPNGAQIAAQYQVIPTDRLQQLYNMEMMRQQGGFIPGFGGGFGQQQGFGGGFGQQGFGGGFGQQQGFGGFNQNMFVPQGQQQGGFGFAPFGQPQQQQGFGFNQGFGGGFGQQGFGFNQGFGGGFGQQGFGMPMQPQGWQQYVQPANAGAQQQTAGAATAAA